MLAKNKFSNSKDLFCNLRDLLKNEKRDIFSDFENHKNPEKLLKKLKIVTDEVLKKTWMYFKISKNCSLVAVGGFGRGEIYPYSDIDILILLSSQLKNSQEEKIEKLIQFLWDLGLEVGSSVRTINECLSESKLCITTQTSLLDSRLICGSRKLFKDLKFNLNNALNPCIFFQEKMLESQRRHLKHNNTPFNLEPNCKESPGGLRDLQIIIWVTKAAKIGNTWNEIASKNFITRSEAKKLKKIERAFKDIRIRLHILGKRKQDKLIFEYQTLIAETFGFKDSNERRKSEFLMQKYFIAAKNVSQLNCLILQNIENYLFPQKNLSTKINDYFYEINNHIEIIDEIMIKKNPSIILEIFLLAGKQNNIKGISARTQRIIWNSRFFVNENFRKVKKNKQLFIQILQLPKTVTKILRQMNELSILGRYLPSFQKIIGQMQHDLFHVYTVDQHTLMVLRNVERFHDPQHSHEYPLCSELITNFPKNWLIYVAAIFHDIAKGRGGDHSLLGKKDTEDFCKVHNISNEDTNLVTFLVEHHLLMSHVAQKKDITDTKIVNDFLSNVKSERNLIALYLLTVADIRGTSPHVWNSWKAKLLEDLFKVSLKILNGKNPFDSKNFHLRQKESLKILKNNQFDIKKHEEFWENLNVGYFLQHDSSEIAWHTQFLYDKLYTNIPAINCRSGPIEDSIQVLIFYKDQLDLFARICNYFEVNNFSILEAKIQTTSNGYALDTFLVTTIESYEENQEIRKYIEGSLKNELSSQKIISTKISQRKSRLSKNFPIVPKVQLQPDDSGNFYFLNISACDQKGLLFTIATILANHKINLFNAKITTLGERVEDVFLVAGKFLSTERKQIALETDLINALRI